MKTKNTMAEKKKKCTCTTTAPLPELSTDVFRFKHRVAHLASTKSSSQRYDSLFESKSNSFLLNEDELKHILETKQDLLLLTLPTGHKASFF